MKLTTECWDAAEVRKQLDALRAKDEETVLDKEADAVRMLAAVTSDPLATRLVSAMPAMSCDGPMNPLPPSLTVCTSFIPILPSHAGALRAALLAAALREAAARLAASGLCRGVWRRLHRGHRLEGGSMHVSLEVVVLALQQVLREGGSAEAMLPHSDRSALNSVLAALGEAKRLAYKLAHASSAEGQQRVYLSRVIGALSALEPGGVLPVPCNVSGASTFLLVRRGSGAESDRCTVAVVGCDAENRNHGHRFAAAPPKIRCETCLELRDVDRGRLLDEALWVIVSYAGAANDGKLSARRIFYQVVLSYLSERSSTRLSFMRMSCAPTRVTKRSTARRAAPSPPTTAPYATP